MKIHTKTVLADIDIPEHPKGIIHFIHGMMEEITDYEFLVKQITQNGYICVRQEITGHGELAVNEKKGYMGKSPVGWNQAVLSIQEVYQQVRNVCGTQYPYFMIGFSLYPLSRRFSYLFNYPQDIKPDWEKLRQEISIKDVLEPYRKENMDEIRKMDLSLSGGKEG